MANSILIAGGASGQVAIVDCVTLAVTSLPNAPLSALITSVAATSDSDIWVGYQTSTNAHISHWDGLSWTNYQIPGLSTSSLSRRVGSIVAISASEAYASVSDTQSSGAGYLIRWDGAAWSSFRSLHVNRTSGGFIARDATFNDMWVFGAGSSISHDVIHWNGTTIDEAIGVNGGGFATIRGHAGLGDARFAGFIDGEAYQRAGAGSWPLAFDVGSDFAASGVNDMVADPDTGNIWSVNSADQATVWDGVSLSTESLGLGLGENAVGAEGVISPTGGFQVWTGVNPGAAARYRDPATGMWSAVSLAFSPRAIGTLQGDISSPPSLSDESPASGTSGWQPDVGVSLTVSDIDGDLATDTVRITVNGQLAYRGLLPMPGWSSVPIMTTDGQGYSFVLTPAMPFEPGSQVVEVYAEDDVGNALDTSYSFDTSDFIEFSGEPELDDPATGLDLRLDGAMDISTDSADLQLVAGVDEVVQHLTVGLGLFKGEWYLDEGAGVPYYGNILVDRPSTSVVEGVLRRDILTDEDVEELTDFEMSVDMVSRSISVDFKAKSKIGVVKVNTVFP